MKTERQNRWVRLAAQVWTAAFSAYFMWEAVSYRGFFARLAEFQIARFGSYVPLLTFLLLVAVVAIPAWLLARFVSGRRKDQTLALEELFAVNLQQAKRLRAFLAALGATALAVSIGFVVFASVFQPSQNGDIQTISASEAGTVVIKPGPARLVGGELGTIIFFGQDWFVGDDRMAFSPYRPTAGAGNAARLFVQLEAQSKQDLEKVVQRPAWSGIIVEGGLPGPVRVLFNQIGIGTGPSFYTLYQNEYSLKIRHWLQAIQWGILAAFAGILVALQSRTIRRLERRQIEPEN